MENACRSDNNNKIGVSAEHVAFGPATFVLVPRAR